MTRCCAPTDRSGPWWTWRWRRNTDAGTGPCTPGSTGAGKFTVTNSNHGNHTVQTRALHAYLRWRNKNTRHPDVLAAQRRERARIRSEKGIRWGGRPLASAT